MEMQIRVRPCEKGKILGEKKNMLEYTILSAHNVDVCKFGGDEDERYLAFLNLNWKKGRVILWWAIGIPHKICRNNSRQYCLGIYGH